MSEGEDVYEVDFNLCTECIGFYDDRRCMLVCPVTAVIFDPDQQESEEELRSKYRRLQRTRRPIGGWD
jgi:ferredoxin